MIFPVRDNPGGGKEPAPSTTGGRAGDWRADGTPLSGREEALVGNTFAEGGSNLLVFMRHLPVRPVLTDASVPAALRVITVEAGRASDYDALLAGGAS
jgi:hypothetical protein